MSTTDNPPCRASGTNPAAPVQTAPVASAPGLFREQALAARHRILEHPLRLRAPGLQRAALLLVLVCLLGAGLLAIQPYSEKVTVQGYAGTGAGHVRVRAADSAVVESIAVTEGQWVEAGDVLLRLNSDAVAPGGRSRGAVAQRALVQEADALAQQRLLLDSGHRLGLQRLQTERLALEQRGELLQQALVVAERHAALAQRQAEQLTRLVRSGAVAVAVADQQQQEALASTQNLIAAQRAQADNQQAQALLRERRRALRQEHRQATAEWSADSARLQQRQAAQSVASVRLMTATAAGFVSALNVQVGERLRASQHVLSLLQRPAPDAAVSLLVPSRARGAVAEGQLVRLRYAGYPYEKFGMPQGRIARISRAPVRGRDLEYPLAAGSWVYLAEVAVPGYESPRHSDWTFQPLQVAPGMGLEADIVVRSDPLWERVLEPLARLWHRA